MLVGQLDIERKSRKKSELMNDELDILAVYTRSENRNSFTPDELDHISSLVEVEQALGKFNLNKSEIRVYLYLARFGAQKAQSVAEALGVHRTEGYKVLRRLEAQGIVSRIMERPMKFIAVPFESVLTNLIEERRQRIHEMERKKDQLLKIWASLPEPESVSQTKETFQVLEGKKHISVRLNELLKGSETSFKMVVSDINLIWLYNTPFLDEVEDKVENDGLIMKLMTNYSPTSSYVMDQLNIGEGDFLYLKEEKMPGFFINDQGEMILLMVNEKNKVLGMWTNYASIVQSHRVLFDLLWKKK
jgi:sugar-specific transcriptional regulator TrmB